MLDAGRVALWAEKGIVADSLTPPVIPGVARGCSEARGIGNIS